MVNQSTEVDLYKIIEFLPVARVMVNALLSSANLMTLKSPGMIHEPPPLVLKPLISLQMRS